MINVETIHNLATEFLSDSNVFVVDVKVLKGNRIIVLLDGEQGVLVEDCVRTSRAIEASLNRDEEDFELEVSSFGIGTPLMLPRQYQINIGRTARVSLTDGRSLQGVISAVSEKGFTLSIPASGKNKTAQVLDIDFDQCQQTKITVSFK